MSSEYFAIFFVATILLFSGVATANPYAPREPYVAPPYTPPPPIPSRLDLVDNGDGTITETKSQLMWMKKDSFADLGKCLNWYESKSYVEILTTGGHTDWRMSLVREYGEIYDNTESNVMAMDHDPDNPLALSDFFADGAAYWYWSSEHGECCARTAYFVTGMAFVRTLDKCTKGGVRAVRNL
ncbi:DUF1566 domain-containing protein [Nitrospina gracilis]|nr:DUF1566 domain-containing protein [Nitrospina gracilis]